MKDVKLHRFKSDRRLTPFAPEWDYRIIEGVIENVDFNYIAKYLLEKKDEILKLDATHDGSTGLGKDTTTARHTNFNIFNFKDAEINKLKANITSLHNTLLNQMGMADAIPYIDLYTQCWYNVMSKGQQISIHQHDISPKSYLGGHISVQCEDTFTGYCHPAFVNLLGKSTNDKAFVHESNNTVGKITLFPDYIPHFTSLHQGNRERITIAFDIFNEQPTPNFIKL
tara:strand:- start:209 stop:886 length:678 start_codon:yes stop_codon:yes gene_type:complete